MGETFKEPLKRIFNNIIPNEIIKRKKVGFPVPLKSIYFAHDERKTPMDLWLDFNINTLTRD